MLPSFSSTGHSGCNFQSKWQIGHWSDRLPRWVQPVFLRRHRVRSRPWAALIFALVSQQNAPADVQLELTDIQCDSVLKQKFTTSTLDSFYSSLKETQFTHMFRHRQEVFVLFGSTYIWTNISVKWPLPSVESEANFRWSSGVTKFFWSPVVSFETDYFIVSLKWYICSMFANHSHCMSLKDLFSNTDPVPLFW